MSGLVNSHGGQAPNLRWQQQLSIFLTVLLAFCAYGLPAVAEPDPKTRWLQREFAEIQTDAQALSKKLKRNIQPLRFRGVIARRFIERADWDSNLEKRQFDPAQIYGVSAWLPWASVALDVVPTDVASGVDVSIEMLSRWHRLALAGLIPDSSLGRLARFPRSGRNLSKAYALKPSEIQEMESFVVDPSFAFRIHWHQTYCAEDLELQGVGWPDLRCVGWLAGLQAAGKAADLGVVGPFWKLNRDNLYNGRFEDTLAWKACWPRISAKNAKAVDLATKQCGFFDYPSPRSIEPMLKALLARVNSYLKNPVEDPVRFALAVQRQFAVIHPFEKGNGRVSRFLMDFIASKLGLPPLIHMEMNKDISNSIETQVRGTLFETKETLRLMSTCLDFLNGVRSGDGADLAQLCQEV